MALSPTKSGTIYHNKRWLRDQLKRQCKDKKLADSVYGKVLKIFEKFFKDQSKGYISADLIDLLGKEDIFLSAIDEIIKIIIEENDKI